MPSPGFPAVEEVFPDSKEHRRRLARAINRQLSGKLNATLEVTLAAGATTTTVTDVRLTYYSALIFSPLTATAAAAMTKVYVSAQENGEATLTHDNTADTDRTFRLTIIG